MSNDNESAITSGSGIIPLNFDEVPDKIPLIEPGVKTFLINGVPTIEDNNAMKERGMTDPKAGTNLVVKLKVDDEGPDKDRELTHYISTKGVNGKVQMKQLFLAAGIMPGPEGASLADLNGKKIRATLVHRPYKDKASGQEKVGNQIGEIMIPDGV